MGAVAMLLAGCPKAFPPVDLAATPATLTSGEGHWVVLLDEATVDFAPGTDGKPEATVTRRWRVKMLSAGVVPPVTVHYDTTFSRVLSVRGRILSPEGVETALDTSKKADVPLFDASILFQDARVLRVPVPPVPVGGVFESEVVTRRVDTRVWVHHEYLGDAVPVELTRLDVTAPVGWELRWVLHARDGHQLSPAESLEGGRRRWRFERAKLAAVETDPGGPTLRELLPVLNVRLESWSEGGQARHAPASAEALSAELSILYAPRAEADDALRAEVTKTLAGVPDEPEAKARALYERACRAIQYCAIEIGYGGWVPHAATEVQRTGYGDCKDKATHLQAMLRLAGVEAWPTLIFAHDGMPRDFGLPSMGSNFNHAILAVKLGDRTVYADPTHRAVPFGELPVSDQGAPVLEVRPGGAPLAVTPQSTADDNEERQHFTLSVRPDGDAEGTVAVASRGARAQPFKWRWLTGTGLANRWLEGRLWARSAFVTHVEEAPLDDFAPEARVAGQVLVRRVLGPAVKGQLLLRPADFLAAGLPRVSTQRRTPLLAKSAERLETTLELTLPAGAAVTQLPPPVEVANAVGRYALRWALEGSRLRLTREVVRAQRQVPVPLLPEADALAAAAAEAELTPVVLALGAAR